MFLIVSIKRSTEMQLHNYYTPESMAATLYEYATENNSSVNVVVSDDHSVHLVEHATTGANFFTMFFASTYAECLEVVLADWSDFENYMSEVL